MKQNRRKTLPLSCVLTVVLGLTALTSVASAFSGFLPGVLPDTIVPVFHSSVAKPLVPAERPAPRGRLEQQMRFLLASQRVFERAA